MTQSDKELYIALNEMWRDSDFKCNILLDAASRIMELSNVNTYLEAELQKVWDEPLY